MQKNRIKKKSYFWEVANQMATLSIDFCENVEEKWFNIKVQCFVIEEQFGQEAEVLTINLERNKK